MGGLAGNGEGDTMKEPSAAFLIALAAALKEAAYPNVAQSMGAGFLWSLYPEWFDKHFPNKPKIEDALKAEYESTFGHKPY